LNINLFEKFAILFSRNSDGSKLIDERDNELLKLAKEVLNKLNKKETIYLYGITLDLTYLNKKYGYEIGSRLKSKIFELLRNYKSLYILETGGKIIAFTSEPLEKNKIGEIERKVIKNSNKIIFIEEKILKIDDIEELFAKEIILENNLMKIRGKIQEILKGKNLEIENDLKELSSILNNKLDFKLKEKVLSSDYKELYKKVKKSPLLTKALYFKSKNEHEFFLLYAISYYLWIEIILVIGELFKKEKINTMINKKENYFKLELMDNKKLKEIEDFFKDLLIWFQSVIQPFYPFLNSELRSYAKEIERDIKNLDENIKIKDLKKVNEVKEKLIKEINNFVEKLEILNLTIPLTNKLHVNEKTFTFFRRQLYLIANKNLEEVLKNVFIKFGKRNFYLILDGKEGTFEKGIVNFINCLFKYNDFEHLYVDSAFLELDGFNAFNFYVFPNEYDEIYNEIINTFFETANDYVFLKNSKDLKNNKELYQFVIAGLGDEFFIFFFSDKKIDRKKIKGFLQEIQRRILEKTKKYVFPKTEKYKINCEKGELIFRRLILKEKKLFWKNYDDVVLARLGVSVVYLHNALFLNKKEILNDIKTIEEKLNVLKKILEKKMIIVKNKYKGCLKEYDLNFDIAI
jgi:hypothetical protein